MNEFIQDSSQDLENDSSQDDQFPDPESGLPVLEEQSEPRSIQSEKEMIFNENDDASDSESGSNLKTKNITTPVIREHKISESDDHSS